tara:strand:- start:1167 stop:1499 length:333 start_codon:yes stop_codon:yes gene_type:complete
MSKVWRFVAALGSRQDNAKIDIVTADDATIWIIALATSGEAKEGYTGRGTPAGAECAIGAGHNVRIRPIRLRPVAWIHGECCTSNRSTVTIKHNAPEVIVPAAASDDAAE